MFNENCFSGLRGEKGLAGRAGNDGIPGEKGELGDRGPQGIFYLVLAALILFKQFWNFFSHNLFL